MPEDWKARALAAEGRLMSFFNRMINPPITILRLDYQERCETAQAKLREFRHIVGRLYWRSPDA